MTQKKLIKDLKKIVKQVEQQKVKKLKYKNKIVYESGFGKIEIYGMVTYNDMLLAYNCYGQTQKINVKQGR